MDSRRSVRLPRLALALLGSALLGGCATADFPPLEAMDREIELQRFMGDWYVIGFIPIDLPFFSEADAHNAVESYELAGDGIIETTYTFREGSFDGPERQLTPKGWVHDEKTHAEWRMQFVWPFRAAYLIVHVDPDYRNTIIGVPDRKYLWIMSRQPEIPSTEYDRLLRIAGGLGYDTASVQRVPQRWP